MVILDAFSKVYHVVFFWDLVIFLLFILQLLVAYSFYDISSSMWAFVCKLVFILEFFSELGGSEVFLFGLGFGAIFDEMVLTTIKVGFQPLQMDSAFYCVMGHWTMNSAQFLVYGLA